MPRCSSQVLGVGMDRSFSDQDRGIFADGSILPDDFVALVDAALAPAHASPPVHTQLLWRDKDVIETGKCKK